MLSLSFHVVINCLLVTVTSIPGQEDVSASQATKAGEITNLCEMALKLNAEKQYDEMFQYDLFCGGKRYSFILLETIYTYAGKDTHVEYALFKNTT